MKKTLALVLALVMVLSLFAGCVQEPTPTDPSTPNNPSNPSNPSNPTDPSTPSTPATYTYNYAMSEFPTNWNFCTYQTATDADILDYIVDGFYSFDYNEDMTGYQMVNAMATGDPIDVTAEYVGQFGVEEGDKAKVYIIPLRDDLVWENGDKITANDFVESAKRLLAPEAQNYRADSMYSGSVKIYGAEAYLKQGLTVLDAATTKYTEYSEAIDSELVFSVAPASGSNGEAAFRKMFGFDSTWDLDSTIKYLVTNCVPNSGYTTEVANAMEGKTLAEIKADPTLKAGWDAVIGWWQTDPNEELHFFLVESTYPEYSWDNVGWFAKSDYELVFAMTNELSGFYLKYGMPSPLVHIPTYDACASLVDGVYTNTYCTSAETTMSYGPYKLTSFQKDKEYTLVRNDNYYGHGEGLYQTTNIKVQMVKEAETRHEMFQKGQLDSFGLTIDYMETYQLSDHTYYSTGDSTFAITFNPDPAALVEKQAAAGENINKTILTILEFRQAMSFSVDRNAFALATAPMNAPGFGLMSGLIVSDPEVGTAYRSTPEAKEVLAKFWGVWDDIGEGKLYEDIDEAIDSITGYNLAKAKQLFDAAYDKAIAAGLMDADDKVQICIGTPNNTSAFYNNGYEFLVNNYQKAVEGTKLEGKLEFTRDDTLGNAFSDALNNNQVDMLFGVGWTGSALDPYGLMQVYVDPEYQYDDSYDYTVIDLTVNINGKDYTTDCQSWFYIMNGEKLPVQTADGEVEYSCGVADNDPAARLAILAALEGAILMNYNFIPIIDDASASMKGMQIEYKTEEYVFGMGFGGIKYYTYNYTDAEWDAFVASNDGILDYT